jgi:hypothetical protein
MADELISIDSPDLVKFYKAVKGIDVEVQKQLRKRLTNIAKPIAQDVKDAALAIPASSGAAHKGSRGEQGLGLRAGIAAAVQTKVNATNGKKGFSMRIHVSGTTFATKTGKYKKLPRYMEGLSRKPWRHPVFADAGAKNGTWSGKWVAQSAHPYLIKTAAPYKSQIQEEVSQAFLDAMEETGLIK